MVLNRPESEGDARDCDEEGQKVDATPAVETLETFRLPHPVLACVEDTPASVAAHFVRLTITECTAVRIAKASSEDDLDFAEALVNSLIQEVSKDEFKSDVDPVLEKAVADSIISWRAVLALFDVKKLQPRSLSSLVSLARWDKGGPRGLIKAAVEANPI